MRQRSCNCGECPKCKKRIEANTYYWANREKILAKERQKRQDNPEWAKARDRTRYERDKKKVLARRTIQNAIWRGVLQRQPCEICGNEISEAHHDDYDKPWDVRWLCKQHHMEHHERERAAA